MTQANSPLGVSVVQEGDLLVFQFKNQPGPGIAMVSLALTFMVPIGIYLVVKPFNPSDLSFVYVFGPILTFTLFMGIRHLVNSTSITADATQLVVRKRPLPLWKAKRVPAADLQSFVVKVTKNHGKSGTKVYYAVFAVHRDERTTRLMKVEGLELKETAHFVKEKLEQKFGLWRHQ